MAPFFRLKPLSECIPLLSQLHSLRYLLATLFCLSCMTCDVFVVRPKALSLWGKTAAALILPAVFVCTFVASIKRSTLSVWCTKIAQLSSSQFCDFLRARTFLRFANSCCIFGWCPWSATLSPSVRSSRMIKRLLRLKAFAVKVL